MISPRPPLIALVALIVVPALTTSGLAPSLFLFPAIVIALIAIFALVDAIFFAPKFETLRVSSPEIVRLSKNREGEIDLRITWGGRME